MEEKKASPELAKFFERLLDIKKFVKDKYEETKDELLNEIHKKLDGIIKSEGDLT